MNSDPRRLGKYELQRLVGGGGIVEVWQAIESQAQRAVAIKLFRPDLTSDPGFLERFEREAEQAAALHHPNIVQVHDFQIASPPAVESPVAYLVLEAIEGQQLADYIRATSGRRNFPAKETLVELFAPLCAAVDYAHQQGIIHRNINTTNIVLDTRNTARSAVGEPMLTDFGVASILDMPSNSRSGELQGNPDYLAPEQLQGYRGNEFSDIYSLGVILYELCTGALPFQASDAGASVAAHTSTSMMPTAPALLNPNIAPPVTMVLLRGLSKEPTGRYASATAMVSELADVLNVALPEGLSASGYVSGGIDLPTYVTPVPASSSPSWPRVGAASIPFATDPAASQNALAASRPLHSGVLATPPGSVSGGQPSLQTPISNGASAQVEHTSQDLSTFISSPPGTNPDRQRDITSPPERVVPALRVSRSERRKQEFSQPPLRRKRRRGLMVALIALVLLLLGGIAAGIFYLFPRTSAANPDAQVVGHAFFVSSGQINSSTNLGLNDGLRITLTNIAAPAPGKSYYAWLLSDIDTNEAPAILLGQLSMVHGSASLSYNDKGNTNLLAITSRLLITEEDAQTIPVEPTFDKSAWKYMAQFPRTIAAGTQFSLLDHLRHLLSGDPPLDQLGLHGGLASLFEQNTESVMIWAGSARDYWRSKDVNGIRAQLIRILDVLDSATYVEVEGDVPPGTPLLINTRVALLEFDAVRQTPPGYLEHIGRHLSGVITAPGATADQMKLAIKINQGLDNVLKWLEQVRLSAKQLLYMSDHSQLLSQASLSTLDNIAALALYAYVGQLDPTTNQVLPGAVQIRDNLALLATFAIEPYIQQ